MTPKTNHPWWCDLGDDMAVIRDRDGDAVCAMPRADDVNERLDQDAIAALIAMAPELFCCLYALVDIVRRCDAETIRPPEDFASDDEYEAALDDATALLELLADDGITCGASA